MVFRINDTEVVLEGKEGLDVAVAKDYLTYAEEHKLNKDAKIGKLTVAFDPNSKEADITIDYVQDKPKIERIRRITGLS